MRIAYLGPEGSYSRLAAMKFCPDAEFYEFSTFKNAAQSLEGVCDCVVLPIENSLNGSVTQNLDLLQEGENLIAYRELTLKIDHRLAIKNGADKSKIKRIFSHSQALAQCGEYLHKNFPQAILVGAPSTAASLDMLENDTDACIVGAHVVRDGVSIGEENIADEKENYTRFLLVRKGCAENVARANKVYFSATCKHVTGGLVGLLQLIADEGFNLTKIESRPVKEKFGEYRFFIETEGDYFSDGFTRVLKAIESGAGQVKILGIY